MSIQKNSNIIVGVIIIIILVIGIVVYRNTSTKGDVTGGVYDEFATCIADSGAEFFGASWCPPCNRQKAEFGESAFLLPYVECSQVDSREQTIQCKKFGIEAYPTWRFVDGSEIKDMLSFEDLSKKTGCKLPVTQSN